MEWDLFSFVASGLAITLGAILQASTGFGAGLIIVPLLALISLDLIPGPMVLASLALSLLMAYRGRREINFINMDKLLIGLLGGTIIAAFGISAIPISQLSAVFGVLILVAVAISMIGVKARLTPLNMFTAGALSGFMGTTAGIGAPVLVLLYQNEGGKTIRSTLGFLYFVASIVMLLVLHLAGHFGSRELLLGLYLVPGFIVGYLISGKLAKLLDKGYSRIAVLVISAISALILIVKSLI